MWENIEKRKEEEIERVMKNVQYEFYQGYKLSSVDRYIAYNYTDFAIDYEKENVLVYVNYCAFDEYFDGSFGKIHYSFYLIENDGRYYIKYFNVLGLSQIASKCAKKIIDNGLYCEEIPIGLFTKEYRTYVKDNIMKSTMPIEKTEIIEIMKYAENEVYSERFLESFGYEGGNIRFDIVDFYNGNRFYADDYALKEYEGIIRLSDFILKKCRIADLQKNKIKTVEKIEEAMEKALMKAIERKYAIM